MDALDKQLLDLQDTVQKLNVVIAERNRQIDSLKKSLSDFQEKETGINAVREALDGERSLVILLNKQIDSYKSRVQTLQALNDDLTALNMKLQRDSLKAPANDLNLLRGNSIGQSIDPSAREVDTNRGQETDQGAEQVEKS